MITRMRTVRHFAWLFVKIVAKGKKYRRGKKKTKMIICGGAFDIMGCRSLYEQD